MSSSSHPAPSVKLSDAEWKVKLTPQAYYVLREKGTERPFTGTYDKHKEDGMYHCAGCSASLFPSESKFDSGCGWPAFKTPLSTKSVIAIEDNSMGIKRTEIQCANCHGHLGHVFDDGPGPEGTRYCINSVSLQFKKE